MPKNIPRQLLTCIKTLSVKNVCAKPHENRKYDNKIEKATFIIFMIWKQQLQNI